MPEEFVRNPKIADIQTPGLRDFFDIWINLHSDEGLPKSKNFPLTVFEHHLPYVILIDYDAATARFLIKYFGSSYADGIGQDFTNHFMNDVPDTDHLITRSSWLVDNKQPYLARHIKIIWSPKNYRTCSAIACPLFGDAGNVSSIVYRIEFGQEPL